MRVKLSGKTFGRLIVYSYACRDDRGKAFWYCYCDCGTMSIVAGHHLQSGATTSCGCLGKEKKHKHGLTRTGTHTSWSSMKQRCFNPKAPEWKNYGARGITVCDRWLNFENFLADMGVRPNGLSLDRIDSNGNYEPGNCRWATTAMQQDNRREGKNRKWIDIGGVSKPAHVWGKENGISSPNISARIKRGWDPVRAVTEPIRRWS